MGVNKGERRIASDGVTAPAIAEALATVRQCKRETAAVQSVVPPQWSLMKGKLVPPVRHALAIVEFQSVPRHRHDSVRSWVAKVTR